MSNTNRDVVGYLKSSFDDKKMSKIDDGANAWFGVFVFVSLVLWILQASSFALSVNIGLQNAIASGFLYSLYLVAKYYEHIDMKVTVYAYVRWYLLMLISAFIATSVWYLIEMRLVSIPPFGQLIWRLVVFVICGAASFIVFHQITKFVDRRVLDLSRRRGMTRATATRSRSPLGSYRRDSEFLL